MNKRGKTMDKFKAAFASAAFLGLVGCASTGTTVTQKTESYIEFPMRIVGAEPRKPEANDGGSQGDGIKLAPALMQQGNLKVEFGKPYCLERTATTTEEMTKDGLKTTVTFEHNSDATSCGPEMDYIDNPEKYIFTFDAPWCFVSAKDEAEKVFSGEDVSYSVALEPVDKKFCIYRELAGYGEIEKREREMMDQMSRQAEEMVERLRQKLFDPLP